MRVLFERTGGFAGRKLQGALDSSRLSVPKARKLKELLKKSGFFELPSTLVSSEKGADRFSYRVTVETDDGRHTVETSEAAIPGQLRPLLDFLTRSLLEELAHRTSPPRNP
jgi:hypothetical protein